MRKHIFFLPTLLTTAIVMPTIVTSCSKKQSTSFVSEIKIDLPQNQYEIDKGETLITDPIIVKCLDLNGNEVEAATNLFVVSTDGKQYDWISINDKKQILIDETALRGRYTFNVYAQLKDKSIKSQNKTLTIEINEWGYESPDSIDIQTDTYCPEFFISTNGNFELQPIPAKAGYDERLLSRDCDWTIENIDNIPNDLLGNKLFYLEQTNHNSHLMMSTDIDHSYHKLQCEIVIKAVSKLNHNATDSITLTINIYDGLEFEEKGLTYTRQSFDDEWEISKANEQIVIITPDMVLESKYNFPVTKIADNFCFNSRITKMSVLLLPPWIKTIGVRAFADQGILIQVSLPGVTCVMKEAFSNDLSLIFYKEEDEPRLEMIGERAFYNCQKMKLTKEENLSIIEDEAFAKTKFESVALGNNVQYIGFKVFSDCFDIKHLYINTIEPPELVGSLFYGIPQFPFIHVPNKSILKYQTAPTWLAYADYICGYD